MRVEMQSGFGVDLCGSKDYLRCSEGIVLLRE